MTMTNSEQALADLLTALRRGGRRQSGLGAALVPPDAESAYRTAARVARDLGWPVGGWKIAANKPEMQAALRATEPIMGRVFAPFIHTSPATLSHARLLWPVVEGELVVRLAEDLPPRTKPYSEDEVADAVAAIHVGIEVAECRFVHDDAFPPLPAILADGAGSGHLVVGPAIDGWRTRDLASQNVVMRVDGTERRHGDIGAAIGHPLTSVTWLANRLATTGDSLKSGQVVSTGTCTGMYPAKPDTTCQADFGALGAVDVTFASDPA